MDKVELRQATYTLYSPNTNQIEFRTVRYRNSKGFQIVQSKQVKAVEQSGF